MDCFSPLKLAREDSTTTVPCGKCIPCLQRKRAEWLFRLGIELKNSSSAYFITLTYDDEHLIYNDDDQGQLYKKHCQDFLKRLRWSISNMAEKMPEKKGNTQNLRYFIVGEYGTKGQRPHYHGLFFNLPVHGNIYLREKWLKDFLEKSWQKGFVHVGLVTEASINYCLKYILTPEYSPDNSQKQFSLMSKRPYLGYMYEVQNKKGHIQTLSVITKKVGGEKVGLPRIYRNKMFNQEQRKFIAEMNTMLRLKKLSGDNYFENIMKNNSNFGLYDLEFKKQYSNSIINKANKNNCL